MIDHNSNREKIYNKVIKFLENNNIRYIIGKDIKKKFINNQVNIYGEAPLILSLYDSDASMKQIVSAINKEISSLGGEAKRDSYNTIYVYYDELLFQISPEEHVLEDTNIELDLPDNDDIEDLSLEELLNQTDDKHIYLSSDWHLFKNHYKHEANYVNTQKIITWCRQNIKDNDIFMYLGDISFRYANEEDQNESARLFRSLPGIKILILGNHDRMLADEYHDKYGFKFVFEKFEWGKYVFTHRPINMSLYPDDYLNIHGHIHNIRSYNTCDGKRNINVYPMFYNNKPVTLNYLINHVEKLTKFNFWNKNYGYDESTNIQELEKQIAIKEDRADLPDKAFGIPEDRKFPLDTEKHVKSAIKLFGHAEESKKKDLAKRIKNAAKKYDISIPENTQCYKYLNEGAIEDIIPSYIDTIIFDMGNVIVNSDIHTTLTTGLPVDHYLAHVISDYVEELLLHNDKKLEHYSLEEAKEFFIANTGYNVNMHTERIFELLNKAMYVFPFVVPMFNELRKRGYKIYYLSNWPRWSLELLEPFFNKIINKFDGGVFSGFTQYAKPDKEFYDLFINKYNLNPETCFFFDDKAENINSAENAGIKGYLFDPIETPRILLNYSALPSIEINNKIIVNNGLSLENVDIAKIPNIYCFDSPNNIKLNNTHCYRSIDNAVKDISSTICDSIDKYLYTSNDNNELIPIGQIRINSNGLYEWLIQYPLKKENNNFINEMPLNTVNPIIGITKAFIIQYGMSDSIISPKKYALSPDIISDKYLVIDENAKLKIVDSSIFENCNIEIYEFIGNKKLLSKIAEKYINGSIVDNTVFYTSLTGKPMLCEDQIDFDIDNFRRINIEQTAENSITKMASLFNGYIESCNYVPLWTSVMESQINNNYIKYGDDISIKKDIDGYYVYSEITKLRSRSVESISSITEEMVISVMGGNLY